MKKRALTVLSCSVLFITACAPVNTNFSCKVTAGDSCLTIEEVDARTAFADDVKIPKHHIKTNLPHQAYYLTRADKEKGAALVPQINNLARG